MSVNRSPRRSAGLCDPSPTARRARNPQGQGGRLRAELIEAADRILSRTGDLEGLSLRAVAREVGVATPSIYLHFPDKASLVRAVLTARFEELGTAVRTAVEQALGSAEQLRAGCLAYCRFGLDHPNAYRVLFGRVAATPVGDETATGLVGSEENAPGPDAAEAFREHPGSAAFGFLVEGVRACMRDETAPEGDPLRIATAVWTAMHGIVSLRGTAPGFPWPPLSQQVDDVLDGLVKLHHRAHHNPPASEG